MPVFAQQVDVQRPHTLLTMDAKRSGSLEFRYDDTQEVVSVPNIWYNQTFELRVSAVRRNAKLAEEQAAKYKKNPPFGVSEEIAADIARRYRERAGMIHAESRPDASGRRCRLSCCRCSPSTELRPQCLLTERIGHEVPNSSGVWAHLADAMKELDDKVTKLLAEGWMPCGGVALLYVGHEAVESRRYAACQAVTLTNA